MSKRKLNIVITPAWAVVLNLLMVAVALAILLSTCRTPCLHRAVNFGVPSVSTVSFVDPCTIPCAIPVLTEDDLLRLPNGSFSVSTPQGSWHGSWQKTKPLRGGGNRGRADR